MALIEIDGLPIKDGGSFHGYVSHNQMVITVFQGLPNGSQYPKHKNFLFSNILDQVFPATIPGDRCRPTGPLAPPE